MPRQLSFDLSAKTALGRDDFFVSPANAAAVGLIESWQSWPSRKLILTGPAGAGKTHLSCVWAAQAGATVITANGLPNADIPALANANVAVENIETIAKNDAAEAALFHLHNMVLAEGHSLLLTATKDPKYWGLRLPDLVSRMQATTLIKLEAPDDALLSALLMKQFADRQLSPAPDTIPYLMRRMPRSSDAVRTIVALLDDTALETGLPINRTLARRVLDKLEK